MNDFFLQIIAPLLIFVPMLLMATVFIISYVRHHRKATQQRVKIQKLELKRQKELLSAVIHSQEKERKRIGQDLHDDVGVALSSLRLAIDLYVPDATSASAYREHASFCKTLIDKVIEEVRNISHHLAPATLNYKGLLAALENHVQLLNRAGKLRVELLNDVNVATLDALDAQTSTALYRVIEELLNNTLKHAGATLITISFSEDKDSLKILYTDNGRGLPDNTGIWRAGIGFQNIESKLDIIHATYTLATCQACGFKLAISCPVSRQLTF